jgi:penicillin amidase
MLLLLACTPSAQRPSIEYSPPETCDPAGLPLGYTPSAAVTVKLDDVGIPHLYAQNDPDLFWAAGYQQATDRLFEIDSNRRAAVGTLAEVRGEDGVDSDRQARVIGFARLGCQSAYDTLEAWPEAYAMLQSFAAGVTARAEEVNAGEAEASWEFTAEGLDYAPSGLEPWEILAMGRRIDLGFSNQISEDILNTVGQSLLANYDEMPLFRPVDDVHVMGTGSAASGPPTRHEASGARWDEEVAALVDASLQWKRLQGNGPGSNNWVVNGRNTENGRPFLANDPHTGLYDPPAVYTYHLDSTGGSGSIDVAGWAFVGIPGVQLGHTASLAWGATTNQADAVDLYDVATDGEVANVGGDQRPVYRLDEPIDVRGGDAVDLQVELVPYLDGYAVLLPEEMLPSPTTLFADGRLMLAWSGYFAVNHEAMQYLGLNRATDLDDFEAAIGFQSVGMHNWVAAEAEGIRYVTHGDLPVRGSVVPNAVMDADDPDAQWTGEWLGDERFPYLDGSQDFICTANSDPWGHTADNDPGNDAFYYGSWYDPGFRYSRIHRRLEELVAAGPVTLADMEEVQADPTSELALRLVPLIVEAVGQIGVDESVADFEGRTDLAEAAAELTAWDGRMLRSSHAAALFRATAAALTRGLLEDDTVGLFDSIDDASGVTVLKLALLAAEEDIDAITDGHLTRELVKALDAGVAWDTGATWGEVHPMHFDWSWGGSNLVPVDGDDTSINVTGCGFWTDGELASSCDAGAGAIFRQVTSFGDDGVPEMWFAVSGSTSTDWLEGTYRYFPFRDAEVDEHTVETWEIGG